jgi:hypothetical protein
MIKTPTKAEITEMGSMSGLFIVKHVRLFAILLEIAHA